MVRNLAVVAVLLAACGGDGDGPGSVDGARVDAAATDAPGASCALPVPFDVGASYERTLHVAPGAGTTGDGSAAAPISLREAARRATPGTRILMAAGTYRGSTFLEDLVGEAARPILIVADGEVILDAAGAAEALHVSTSRYLVLEGLTIRGATANGLNIDDGGTGVSSDLVLRDLVVSGIGTGGNHDCIKLSGLDRFFVLGGELSGCNAGDAIDMVGCHDGVISGVFIHDTPGGGIQAKGGSARTIMHGNRFADVVGRSVNAGGSTGDPFFRPIDAPYEAADLHVVANVFVRPGAESGAPIAYVGCDGCVFANNTVIDPQTWVARILQERTEPRFVPCRDGVFANNLVVLDVGDLRTFVNVGSNTAPETFSFDHNLWWARDRDAAWTGPTLPAPIPPETASLVQQDPGLVDLAGGDYHLTAGSPAIGAGRVVPGPVYPDLDGRCYGVPTLGAFAAP